MSDAISPLAPKNYPSMPALEDVTIATAMAGIKARGRTDLLVMTFPAGTAVAGVFTKSKCPSAAVDYCRQNLPGGQARVLVVNAGNANAFTGKKGREATGITARAAADAAGCGTGDVYLASTGVIGEPLNAAAFAPLVSQMVKTANVDNWSAAARAIMTTDTHPKMATARVVIDGAAVTINGIAKGSGMIAPDMATMLSFIVTDAPVSASVLQDMIAKGVGKSFNAITVDSDTSTSDTVLVFATGTARKKNVRDITDIRDRRLGKLRRAFNRLLKELAMLVVRDGEGARKLVEVAVTGAKSSRSAKKIALSVANSPLFKTAIAGEDANWGRVVMAVGKAGEPADRDRLSISFGDHLVAQNGERSGDYSEQKVSEYMKRDEIKVGIDMGMGPGRATVWTCDLTKEYVAINGDYRS